MSYLAAFRRDGYAVFEECLPDRIWFDALYEQADSLFESLTSDLQAEWREAALRWLQRRDNASYFCGAPPAFRDRAGTEGKRDKAYLQWYLEFSRSRQFRNTRAASLDATHRLTAGLERLHGICSGLFEKVLAEFGPIYSDFVRRYDPDRPLPICFKLVRYNQRPKRFATDPHFDKSGLSMILRADDDTVQWRLGRGNPCRISEMTAPFEYPHDARRANPGVIFPGLCLEPAGVDISPTPHFVLPVERRTYRHSLIAFLLVPHLKGTDRLDTQAPFIHDALAEVR